MASSVQFDLEEGLGAPMRRASTYGSTPTPPPKEIPTTRRELGIIRKKEQREKLKKIQTMGVAEEKEPKPEHTYLRSLIRRHSHHKHSQVWKWVLHTLICVSVINVVLESESYFQKNATMYFNVFEAIASSIFLVEYAIKQWTLMERRQYSTEGHSPWEAHCHFTFSSESFIDLVSFMPFWIEIAMGINPAKYETIRLLRLIRILKAPVVFDSFRLVNRVLYFNHEILLQAFLVCFIMMLVCSVILYYLRPAVDPNDNFSSILACMYLAILMLTGQGIPNGTMPWYTRIIVAVIALFAIAQFAIPASMLTWGFEQEAEHNIIVKAEKEENMVQNCRLGDTVGLVLSSSSSDENDRAAEWAGYLEQVMGSSSESDSDKNKEKVVGSDSDSDSDSDESKNEKKRSPSAQEALEMVQERARLEQHQALWNLTRTKYNLTPAENRRIKAIFQKLDTDDDGFITATSLRSVTATDDEADDLMSKLDVFKNATGSEHVTLREFCIWLNSVKNGYPHYKDRIFLRLLGQFEQQLKKTEVTSRWKSAKRQISMIKKAGSTILDDPQPLAVSKAPSEANITAVDSEGGGGAAQQLLCIAAEFGSLQKENEDLRAKVALLESKLSQS